MKLLIGIICFILGWVLGGVTKKVILKKSETKKIIEQARRIIADEEKKKEFNKKYNQDI